MVSLASQTVFPLAICCKRTHKQPQEVGKEEEEEAGKNSLVKLARFFVSLQEFRQTQSDHPAIFSYTKSRVSISVHARLSQIMIFIGLGVFCSAHGRCSTALKNPLIIFSQRHEEAVDRALFAGH